MRRLPLFILLFLALLAGAKLLFWSENDYIRIITESFTPQPHLQYGHDEELLNFIVSNLEKTPYLPTGELLLFGLMHSHASQKSIDLDAIFGTTGIYRNGRRIDIYGTRIPRYRHEAKNNEPLLRSGFDIGQDGLVYKLVIPAGKRVVNIMEFGIEPDQVEDLEKMNLSPKANIQVVIPIN